METKGGDTSMFYELICSCCSDSYRSNTRQCSSEKTAPSFGQQCCCWTLLSGCFSVLHQNLLHILCFLVKHKSAMAALSLGGVIIIIHIIIIYIFPEIKLFALRFMAAGLYATLHFSLATTMCFMLFVCVL